MNLACRVPAKADPAMGMVRRRRCDHPIKDLITFRWTDTTPWRLPVPVMTPPTAIGPIPPDLRFIGLRRIEEWDHLGVCVTPSEIADQLGGWNPMYQRIHSLEGRVVSTTRRLEFALARSGSLRADIEIWRVPTCADLASFKLSELRDHWPPSRTLNSALWYASAYQEVQLPAVRHLYLTELNGNLAEIELQLRQRLGAYYDTDTGWWRIPRTFVD